MSNEEHYATISMPTCFRAMAGELHSNRIDDFAICLLGAGEYLVKGIIQDHLHIKDNDGESWYVNESTVRNPHRPGNTPEAVASDNLANVLAKEG